MKGKKSKKGQKHLKFAVVVVEAKTGNIKTVYKFNYYKDAKKKFYEINHSDDKDYWCYITQSE